MIAFLDGKIAAKGQNEVLMDVGGIGFQVSCSTNTLALLPPKGEKFLLWVWMSVRDDGVDLFGFSSQEEKRMSPLPRTERAISPSGRSSSRPTAPGIS